MYDACSYNQFTIVATAIAGQTYAAAGVVDIKHETSTTAASYATDIENLVILQVGSAYVDIIDHVLFAMVSFRYSPFCIHCQQLHLSSIKHLSQLI